VIVIVIFIINLIVTINPNPPVRLYYSIRANEVQEEEPPTAPSGKWNQGNKTPEATTTELWTLSWYSRTMTSTRGPFSSITDVST
jgi:hypothetical protein